MATQSDQRQGDNHGTVQQGHSQLLMTRIRVLLGLPPQQPDSLAAALNERDLDLDLGQDRALGCAPHFAGAHDQTWPARTVDTGPLPPEQVDRLFDEIGFLKQRALSGPMLISGVSLNNYRTFHDSDRGCYTLLLRSGDDLLVIGEYDTIGEAGQWANRTRRYLADVSLRSEGLHIVEHLMLRPLAAFGGGGGEGSDGLGGVDSAFYSLRASIVLPSWTARFSDPRFVSAAEELIQQNLPAHIAPSFIWLGQLQMGRFEAMLQAWQQARGESAGIGYDYLPAARYADGGYGTGRDGEVAIDELAAELASFLRRHAQRPNAGPDAVPNAGPDEVPR